MTNWKVLPISAWHCRPVTAVTGRQSLSPCQGCLLRERPGIFARMASFSLSLRVQRRANPHPFPSVIARSEATRQSITPQRK